MRNFGKPECPSGRLTAETVKHHFANTRQITLEVTDACNLRCMYCGVGNMYDTHDRRENRSLDFKLAIVIYLCRLVKMQNLLYTEKRESTKFKFSIETIKKHLSEKEFNFNDCGFSWGNTSNEIALFVSISCTHCGNAVRLLKKTMEIYPDFTYRLIFINETETQSIVHHFIKLWKTIQKNEFFKMLDRWYNIPDKTYEALRENFPVKDEQNVEQIWNSLCLFNQKEEITYVPAIVLNGKLLSRLYNYQDLFNIVRTLNNEKY